MDNKILYSITGLFDTPDEISHAAEEVRKAGYTKYDVNTPYPVHGLSKRMGIGPSKLGYFSLIIGLTGTTLMLIFMWWVTNVDYPLVIGGKPFFSLPAFIPVLFEVTVLMASLGTVFTMLFFFFKLPNNSHPLHGSEYMENVSVDKFGLYIESRDKKFNEQEVTTLLQSLGAKNVGPLYYDDEEIKHKNRIFEPKFIGFLLFSGLLTAGASYFVLNKLLNMPPFDWMVLQHKINAQTETDFFADGFSMRPPVQGSIARGFMPYMFKGQPDSAGMLLLNPLTPTKSNLELGKRKYNTYCSPCHGYFGKGDARLNGQFPNPPSLHSEKVRNWKDGRIYHIITDGQNIMPSYSSQLSSDEKWAIVLYVRALERALNAKEEDLQ